MFEAFLTGEDFLVAHLNCAEVTPAGRAATLGLALQRESAPGQLRSRVAKALFTSTTDRSGHHFGGLSSRVIERQPSDWIVPDRASIPHDGNQVAPRINMVEPARLNDAQ